MQPKTPKPAPRTKPSELPSPPPESPARAATQADAAELILDGVPTLQRSVRVLLVGASQRGKSTFARKLAAAMAERGCGVLVIHDQKFPDRAQYDGALVASLAELRAAVVKGEPIIVCRAPVTAEEAAGVVRDVALHGGAATLLVDEPRPALKVNPGTGEVIEQAWSGPNLLWICIEGGGCGASFVLLCQLPRMIPGSFLDNATCYAFMGTGGRSLSYSQDLKLVPREAVGVLPGLAVGQLCVFLPDRDWDGRVFGPA
jgi:energy-coupling factor transporter ATP-binding protein EcfA2